MKYSLSLGGDLLTPARDAFDKMMLGVIDRMKKRGLSEGSVTLKLSVTLAKQFPVDDDGNEQEIFIPTLAHEVRGETKQATKVSGEINADIVLGENGGLPVIYSRDDRTIFDIVEEHGRDK